MLETGLTRAGLLDRVEERDVLDRLVGAVRAGESGVLTLAAAPIGRAEDASARLVTEVDTRLQELNWSAELV